MKLHIGSHLLLSAASKINLQFPPLVFMAEIVLDWKSLQNAILDYKLGKILQKCNINVVVLVDDEPEPYFKKW